MVVKFHFMCTLSLSIETHTGRVKVAIHLRLHPNNISMDNEIAILEAWMPTGKKHNNRRTALSRTAERTASYPNNED